MSNQDNTESISAKLRRWADESKNKQRNIYPTLNAGEDFGINLNQKDFIIECELFHRIADDIDAEKREITERYARQSWMNPTDAIAKLATGEIEWSELKEAIDRYYLPRPLFENGEPVHDSDLEEIGGLATCCVYTDGSWVFDPDKFEDEGNPKPWEKQRGLQGDRIKRPKRRVLDADGVPIEVGDKVWLVPGEHCDVYPIYWFEDGVEYTVAKNCNPWHEANGRICITGGDCINGYPMPEQVTHHEQDSLKKLRDEMREFGEVGADCTSSILLEYADRLTALTELDGRDA